MTVFLIILAAIVSTTLGGLFAIRFKDKLHLILGFGAGAIFGVALFDLLPEAIELTTGAHSLQLLTILIAAGFSAYLLIDRFFSVHDHHEEDCENPARKSGLGVLAIIFHSFLDGFSIGLAFKISPAVGWVVAAAVLIHGFADGINTVNMIIKTKGAQKTALKWLAIDALAPAAGVVAANFLIISGPTLGLILSVFIGFFLYISASDLIPESHHRHPAILTSVLTIFGMIVILVAVSLAR